MLSILRPRSRPPAVPSTVRRLGLTRLVHHRAARDVAILDVRHVVGFRPTLIVPTSRTLAADTEALEASPPTLTTCSVPSSVATYARGVAAPDSRPATAVGAVFVVSVVTTAGL